MRHNSGWNILILDVGLSQSQVDYLKQYATVLPYPREHCRTGVYVPSAKARIMILAELPPRSLMLYLDGDTLVFGSVAPLIADYIRSGSPIGILAETDIRFARFSMEQAWLDQNIPVKRFKYYGMWRSLPVLNTGLLLASGADARQIGLTALAMYEDVKRGCRFAEQTIIDSVIYEHSWRTFSVPLAYNCYVKDRYINYVNGVPFLDDAKVVIRHFCDDSKAQLGAVARANGYA
jgi:lipopolysaccharide biosynthesis glycosyltransferase